MNAKERLKDKLLEKLAGRRNAAAGVAGAIGGGLFDTRFMSRFLTNKPRVKALAEGALLLGGAGAALKAGSAIATSGGDAATDPIRKSFYKRRMYKENDWLKSEDQTAVKRVFNTLYRFSPEMAADPSVSAAFVRKGLEFKDVGIQSQDVKTLADIQSAVAKRKSDRRDSSVLSPNNLKSLHALYDQRAQGDGYATPAGP